jgi:hypothetical protein
MQNSPFFWVEYGRIRQQELIEETRLARASTVCPSTTDRLWQWTTARVERAASSLGLHWQVAYTPSCTRA